MAECAGRKLKKKKSKKNREQQHSSLPGNSSVLENEGFEDREILRYLIAAQSNDVETAEWYLKKGMPVDTRCLMFFDTALHKACRMGSLKTIQLMLDYGGDINSKTDDGWSPLHIAVKNRQLGVVNLLLAYGANPDEKSEFGDITPLMLAVGTTNTHAILKQLIAVHSNLDLQDSSGRCALHHCFSYFENWANSIAHSVDFARLLVKAGANMHLKDVENRYPMTLALERMNTRGVKFFLAQNADPDNHLVEDRSTHILMTLAVNSNYQLGNMLWKAGSSTWGVQQALNENTESGPFSFYQPRMLKEACRKYIRHQLRLCGSVGQKFQVDVEGLNIPKSLKDYILLKEFLAYSDFDL